MSTINLRVGNDALTHQELDDNFTNLNTDKLENVVEDTTPQLAGNLDVQANAINTSTTNGSITLTPAGTGDIVLGTLTIDGDQVLGVGLDNYVLTYDNATGKISLEVASGGIVDIVDDTTPQLGGMLDVNGNGLGDGTLELLSFTETASAVNEFTIANAATAGSPVLSATGGDANIGITITPKGTGNAKIGTMTLDSDQVMAVGIDNFVLTYDNATGLASFEAAAGGGGNWLEGNGGTDFTTAPVSGGGGTNCIAVGNAATVDGVGAMDNCIAIGTSADASSANAYADTCNIAIGWSSAASSYNSVAIGNNPTASSNDTIAIGSAATASAASTTAVGKNANASGANAASFGNGATASGLSSVAVSGNATNSYAIAIGPNSAAAGYGSIALGRNTKAFFYGESVTGSGIFAADGDAGSTHHYARYQTTTATQAILGLNNSASTAPTNTIDLSSDSTYFFTAKIVARRTDADGESAAYKIEGCIDNNAGTTALVGTPTVTVIAEDTAAWDVDVVADDTNDAISIRVTGEASKTINWFCDLEMQKVTG